MLVPVPKATMWEGGVMRLLLSADSRHSHGDQLFGNHLSYHLTIFGNSLVCCGKSWQLTRPKNGLGKSGAIRGNPGQSEAEVGHAPKYFRGQPSFYAFYFFGGQVDSNRPPFSNVFSRSWGSRF